MPVVNGYVFKTAGLVNLRSGHVAEGRTHLRAAIEAFQQGTGGIGVGQAAMRWVDLSRSYSETGEADEARRAAETAVEVGRVLATDGCKNRPKRILRCSYRSTPLRSAPGSRPRLRRCRDGVHGSHLPDAVVDELVDLYRRHRAS